MPALNISDPTDEDIVAMADGLVMSGNFTLACKLYGVALRRAPPGGQARIRLRLGIASAQPAIAATHLGILTTLEAARAGSVFVGNGLATWLKTLPFLEDQRFAELADKHAQLLPLANWQWNLQVALWAVQRSLSVEGDFVELGVFKGHTTLFCAEYLNFQDQPKRWWLYDTFDGIPDDQLDPGWAPLNAIYKGTFSYEDVSAQFAPFPNIDVIRGRVPEILAERAPDKIAFLHVDLNNATAEIAALDALFDRISPGGTILFDDYCWASARAQFEAERAWFAARGETILPLPTGQGLFVKR